MKITASVLAILGAVAFVAGIMLLFTFPIMWALNYVFTPAVLIALFGIPQLTFWKTFVLAWVVSTLFKGVATK